MIQKCRLSSVYFVYFISVLIYFLKMGKLLSILARDDANCFTSQKYDVFLDFENAVPTETEREVYNEVQRVLRASDRILEEIQSYKGAGKEVREAISDPNPECLERAWKTILPLVEKLRYCYEHSVDLEKAVPHLLEKLVGGEWSPTQHLETQQALVKQLAEILEFVLKFDEYKMKTPAIQNDFSYYRRVVSRQRNTSDFETPDLLVSVELANKMSLFYAHATPMLKVLSESVSKFVAEHESDIENTTETLGTMAKVCLRMLENPKLVAQFEREETHLLVLRVMVGLVILYDHVHPAGAFTRNSYVDVKGCIRLLHSQPAHRAEPLLNALRYTTKHLNEESTSKSIKNMLST